MCGDGSFLEFSEDNFESFGQKKTFKIVNEWINNNSENTAFMVKNFNAKEFISLWWFYYICETNSKHNLFDEDIEYISEKIKNKSTNINNLIYDEKLTNSQLTDEINYSKSELKSNYTSKINYFNNLLIIITLSIQYWCQI